MPHKITETAHDEIEFDLVTHHGEPMKASFDGSRSQRYMGAMEDNVTNVNTLVALPLSLTEDHDDHHGINTHRELTPG